MAAERQQPRLVAGDQRLEGVVVAAPDERDQALVRLQAQQRRAPVQAGYAGWVVKCGSFHDKGTRRQQLHDDGKVASVRG